MIAAAPAPLGPARSRAKLLYIMRAWLPLLLLSPLACSSNGGGSDAAPDQAAADGGDAAGPMCTAAIEAALKPISTVSTGAVMVLSDVGGVKTLYVDASAGGINAQDMNPRIYLSLDGATKVAVTDAMARTSTMWDLALKRPILFTNSGDAGPGTGGTLFVGKAFDQVTAADAAGKMFAVEHFVDAACVQQTDATGALLTTFDGWYDYDQQTNAVTPKPNTTLIVRGATGKLFKLAVLNYYSTPDGGTGMAGGIYTLKVAAL